MRLITAPPTGGFKTPESIATFVVLESGTCQVPVMASSPVLAGTSYKQTNEIDDDYMSEVYSYPLDGEEIQECNGKTMNMRVDIKLRVASDQEVSAPPSTPAARVFCNPQGGAVAPPSTPTNSICNFGKLSQRLYDDELQNAVIIEEGYAQYPRKERASLRNQSAPPVASQYRTRLSTTSQWIKKRALAELTSARNSTKTSRPATSVRPFSERENFEISSRNVVRICLDPSPHPSQVSMPDLGSFKGKPPISINKRPQTKQSKIQGSQRKSEHLENEELPASELTKETTENNKVDKYVSELRKTIKMRKPGVHDRKRLKPFAVWAISHSEDSKTSVSPDLEKFEDQTRRQGNLIAIESMTSTFPKATTGLKISETHAVKKEMIRQITIPEEKENAGRRNMLEVKGDIPPRAGTCKYIDHGEHFFDSCHSKNGKNDQKNEGCNAFPRSRTTLSSAAKSGSKRYARQFFITSDTIQLRPQMPEKDVFRSRSSLSTSSSPEKNKPSKSLPYIKLRQSVTDYRTYKQTSAPFVRTLI